MRYTVAAALSCAATLAYSADIPVTRGETVVVTASRFEELPGDLPVHVTVITQEEIRSSPARTVPDLLAERAGVFVRDFFGNNASTTTVDLRGFGSVGAQNTLILVDGRRIGDLDLSGVQYSAIPLAAIERIEIVRGGGSVLYGEGATAGVINIITRGARPGDRTLSVTGSAGSYDYREGVVQGAFGSGSVGVSLIGSHLESEGYRQNNQNRQSNALADVRWSAGSNDLSLKVGTDNQGIRLPGARQVQPSAGRNELATDRRGAQTPLDWAQREGNRALIDYRRTLGFGEFTVGAGWREKEQRSYFFFGGFPDYREVDLSVWSLNPRIKLDVPLAGRANSLVIGFDAYGYDYQLRRSNAPTNIGVPFNTIDAEQDTMGVYVLDTLKLTDAFTLAAGARRERLRIDASDVFNPAAPGGAFGSGAPANSQRVYEKAYELAARYQISRGWSLLGKTARSFRFANVDEIYETSPAFTNQFQFLRPQTARSHEVGAEWRRAQAVARATLFLIDVYDEIRLDPFTTGVGNRNLPPSRRRGFELEADARPLQQLGLGLGYSYVDAEFREGVLAGSAFTQQNVNIAGKTVPLVPRHKVTLRASWDFNAATRLSATAAYVDKQFLDNDEPNSLGTQIPAYTLVDLKLSHRRGPWTVSATLNNVFDEQYYNYGVRSQFVADRYNAYPLPERNGFVSVEYRFR